MKVKSAKELRNWIVRKTELITDLKNSNYDPDFLGCINKNCDKFGFFKVYHGDTSSLTSKDKQILFQFLSELDGVGDATLKRLVLFRNQNQRLRPLEDLLKSGLNLPVWLQPYQIDPEEYFSLLNKYFTQKEDVYDQIIYPEWNSIIQHIHSNNEISEFYGSIKSYFDKSTNKASLHEKDYILTEDGFKSKEEVFYSNNLKKVESYKELGSVIKTISNQNLPEKSILDYLSQPPFQTESEFLQEYITIDSIELELLEIETLIQFLDDNREASFTYLCIRESQETDRYLISFGEELHQYYSEQEELNNYIQQHLSETFKNYL